MSHETKLREMAEAHRAGNIGLAGGAQDLLAAADELKRMRNAAWGAVRIIDANLYHQREKVEDAAAILRSVLLK